MSLQNEVKCAILNSLNVTLEKLLQSGGDANTYWEQGKTALMLAVKMASYEIPSHKHAIECVKVLMKYGADRDAKDDNGNLAVDYILSDSPYSQEILDIMYTDINSEEVAR